MKKIISTVALMGVLALPPPATSDSIREDVSTCSSMANAAYEIMKARQNGVPKARIAETLLKVAEERGERSLFTVGMALADVAWSMPRMETPALRQHMAEDFRDKVFSACLNASTPSPLHDF